MSGCGCALHQQRRRRWLLVLDIAICIAAGLAVVFGPWLFTTLGRGA